MTKFRRLVNLFDTHSATPFFSIKSTGLFGFEDLIQPSDFNQATTKTIIRSELIIKNISNIKTVKKLDRLSDLLCTTVDTAEFIRNVHPDPQFRIQANNTHEHLSTFLSQLNTHQGLYNALIQSECTSKDEKIVANLLKDEFMKSGIHLERSKNTQFIRIQSKILSLGHQFISPSQNTFIQLSSQELIGLPQHHINQLIQENNEWINVQEYSNLILKYCRLEETRRKVWLELYKGSDEKADILNQLLKSRGELASVLGYANYASYWLQDKMAKSPDNVLKFLESMQNKVQLEAKEEYTLLSLKKYCQTNNAQLYAWDKQFYTSLAPLPTQLKLSLGESLEFVAWIYKKVFGLIIEPLPSKIGELWDTQVRKLGVYENNELIGVIYCDLMSRDGKFDGAAHFTIKCSRRIDETDEDHDKLFYSQEFVVVRNGHKWQLPVVVLSTGFQKNILLGIPDLETIMHEMGHALHCIHNHSLYKYSSYNSSLNYSFYFITKAMLARTEYQHISGTRVALDFVEVPSSLMERFCKPSIIAQFKNEILGEGMADCADDTIQSCSLDELNQLQMAIIDQEYHSNSSVDTSKVLESVVNNGCIKFVDNTRWECGFSHLYSYGASYYSYSWSRVIVDRIWNQLFKGRNSEEWLVGGELIGRELLSVGGGRSAWDNIDKLGILKEGEKQSSILKG